MSHDVIPSGEATTEIGEPNPHLYTETLVWWHYN